MQLSVIIYRLLFLIIFLPSCEGQKKLDTLKENQQQLTVEEDTSLPIAQYVVDLFEDSKGNLWFGTMEKGVAKFNGQKLNYFSFADGLCGKTISSIAEDKEGNIWFGSHTGLCKFDGQTFSTIWLSEGIHNKGTGWINVQADKKGNIWASSNKGIFRYVDSVFVAFNLPINTEEIATYSITAGKASLQLEDRKGNLWFGTDGYGAFKFDGHSFTRFSKKDGLCSNNITSIIEDQQHNIWFACMQSYQPEMTNDGGVCKYNGETFTQFTAMKGLSENDIYTIYEDNKGSIWIGATGLGVYRYYMGTFTLYNKTDRMDLTYSLGLQDALEDSQGRLWFGFSGGLFRMHRKLIVHVSENGIYKL